MRLWTLHPKYLDSKGLVALWRETLLAKNVLENKTKGYRNHPQLLRFKTSEDPVVSINNYLLTIFLEAKERGYRFDETKFICKENVKQISVTNGQLNYEVKHLLSKLQYRDPLRYEAVKKIIIFDPHPLFKIITGEREPWEVISKIRESSPA
ncbi:MAG: pyrimidine dimer DNA glycosylase/endonuclease V [Candidatus Dadabacteria bacterium]